MHTRLFRYGWQHVRVSGFAGQVGEMQVAGWRCSELFTSQMQM